MVSLRATAISLNILQPSKPIFGGGGVQESQNPKCQDLSKFQLGGGGGVLNQIPEQGVLCNLVKNFWKPSLPVHHR